MSLHPCGDGGRFGPVADCMANDLNQQLDGAMPNGLGFDGLKNPEEAQLVLAFYQPIDSSEGGGGCHRADLYACAGLAAPLGGGAYDISCASCQERLAHRARQRQRALPQRPVRPKLLLFADSATVCWPATASTERGTNLAQV